MVLLGVISRSQSVILLNLLKAAEPFRLPAGAIL